MTIDRYSWGYRRNAPLCDYLEPYEIITSLAETVRSAFQPHSYAVTYSLTIYFTVCVDALLIENCEELSEKILFQQDFLETFGQ